MAVHHYTLKTGSRLLVTDTFLQSDYDSCVKLGISCQLVQRRTFSKIHSHRLVC